MLPGDDRRRSGGRFAQAMAGLCAAVGSPKRWQAAPWRSGRPSDSSLRPRGRSAEAMAGGALAVDSPNRWQAALWRLAGGALAVDSLEQWQAAFWRPLRPRHGRRCSCSRPTQAMASGALAVGSPKRWQVALVATRPQAMAGGALAVFSPNRQQAALWRSIRPRRAPFGVPGRLGNAPGRLRPLSPAGPVVALGTGADAPVSSQELALLAPPFHFLLAFPSSRRVMLEIGFPHFGGGALTRCLPHIAKEQLHKAFPKNDKCRKLPSGDLVARRSCARLFDLCRECCAGRRRQCAFQGSLQRPPMFGGRRRFSSAVSCVCLGCPLASPKLGRQFPECMPFWF